MKKWTRRMKQVMSIVMCCAICLSFMPQAFADSIAERTVGNRDNSIAAKSRPLKAQTQQEKSYTLEVKGATSDVYRFERSSDKVTITANARAVFSGLAENGEHGIVEYKSFKWQWKNGEDWEELESDAALAAMYKQTQPTKENPNISTLEISLPPAEDDDYSLRNMLNGREYRCVVNAVAKVEIDDAQGQVSETVELGAKETAMDSVAVGVSDTLLSKQYDGVKIIVGYLAENETDVDGTRYNSTLPYYQKEYVEGITERKVKASMPETIKVVVEDRTGETTRYVRELPVTWNLRPSSDYNGYDYNATKAVYRYSAAIDLDALQAEETADENGKTPQWEMDASLNGLEPWAKVGWNQEILGLVGENPFDIYTYNEETGMSEVEQRAYLNTHYPKIKVQMQDIMDNSGNFVTKEKEVSVKWEKALVEEYDSTIEALAIRWTADNQTADLQGKNAPMAKYVWAANIDDFYTLTGDLATVKPKATFAWSRVVNRIIRAENASGNAVKALKLNAGSALNSSIPTKVRIELKNPLDGENTEKVVTVNSGNWLIDEGRYYDASQPTRWRTLSADRPHSDVNRNAGAAVVRLKPTLNTYTLSSNADIEGAKVWFQWGKIVTAVKSPDGSSFDLGAAGRIPYVTVKPADQNSRIWANLQTRSDWPGTINVSLLDKTVETDPDSQISVKWNQPANYGPTADNGDYEAFLNGWGSGVYLDEDLCKELGNRMPYVRVYWNVGENLKATDESEFVKFYQKGGNFDIQGAGGVKTTYNNNGYTSVYRVDGGGNTNNSATGNPAKATINNVEFARSMMLVNQRAYVKLIYTVTNHDTKPHTVSIATHADTMINANDRAAVVKTNTGFVMNDGAGKQFNLVTLDSYGVTNVDNMWAGPYGDRTNHMWDGVFTPSVQSTGTDSGLVFSWMNREIAPGATQTFSVMYGIGGTANPPVLREDISANISSDKTKIIVKSNVKDDNGRKDTLYYVLDYGLDTAGSERSLGTVTANGSSFIPINGEIEKPANWADGEYHTIALWAMNEANAMTKLYQIPLVVKTEGGKEILAKADSATVTYQNGQKSGFTVSGTVPARRTDVHVKETITLPSNTLTATNEYRFAGWEDTRTGTIYPAGTKYKITNTSETLRAYWVAKTDVMYYLDVYEQGLDGKDVLTSSTMNIGTRGGTISYTPAAKTGFSVDEAKSVISKNNVTVDNEHLKVYYKRNPYTVKYDSNYAPGLAEIIQQNTGVLYGSTLTGIPNAAKLSARLNSKYFNFSGWKTARNGGNTISADTVVRGDITAYANWTPVTGSAKITFDYNYVNHAQGLTRSDDLNLAAVYMGEGHQYGYGAKVAQMPETPANWRAKDGKIYSFVGWKLGDQYVTTETTFDQYQPVTVTAEWREAYDVTCTYSGKGKITTNAPVVDGKRQPFGAGATAMISWQPETGYTVKHVYVDSMLRDDLIKDGGVIFENLNTNHTVYVEFGAGTGTGDDDVEPNTYTITTDGVGCTFDTPESGVARVAAGSSYTVTWTPAAGYKLAGVTVNGVPMKVTGNQFVFNNISYNQSIKVECVPDGGNTQVDKKGPYRIETKISNGGGIMGPQVVEYNTDKTITWTVPYGFKVRQVLVNQVALNPVPDGTSYTFRNVMQNCSIEVICQKDETEEPDDEDYWLVKTTISNGTITRTSDVGELHTGDSYTVNWMPAEGYYVSRIKIDGQWQGETVDGQWNPTIFFEKVFQNISADHEVEVECLPILNNDEDQVLHHIETEIVNGGTIRQLSDVADGASAVIDWTVASGFEVTKVYLDGELLTDETGAPYIPNKVYTLENITKDHTFKVVCERIKTGGDTPVDPGEVTHWIKPSINVGTIDGWQKVKDGEDCTVKWTPAEGYHVKEVKIDGTAQTVLSGNQWTFDAVTKDTAIDVICEADKTEPAKEQVYYVESAIVSGGSIVGGGEIPVSKDAKVSWTMAKGYQVKSVTLDGTELTKDQLADGGNAYIFDHGQITPGKTYKLVVTCEPIPYYHVTTSSVNAAGISPSMDVKVGDDYTVSWNVPAGYHLKEVTVNGAPVSLPDGQNSYTFLGAEATADEAYFISVVCEKDEPVIPPENPVYAVSTSITGGTITAPQLVSADSGPCVISWNPDVGYHVVSVLIDGKPIVNTLANSYSFNYEEMTGDAEIEVICAQNPKPEYRVTTNMNPGDGVITDCGQVTGGDSYTVNWTAPFGYQVSKVEVMQDGVKTDITGSVSGSYTFTNITSNCEITVTCEKKQVVAGGENEGRYHYIDASISGGTITSDIRTKVKNGDSHTVRWTPDPGYYVAEVKVDGISVALGNNWTFDNVTKAHTVQIICKPSKVSETWFVDVSAKNADTNGSSEIEVGTDYTVRWTAHTGYHVAEVKVDGTPIAIDETDKTGGTYTFSENTAGATHTIEIRCAKDAQAEKTQYWVKTSVENGTITASQQLSEGATVTIHWQPDYGYEVKEVIIDDSNRSTSLSSWTWDAIHSDHSVKVIFGKQGEDLPAENEEYVIGTSINHGGTITQPITVKTAEQKEKQTISWTPAAGYRVTRVLVDNTEREDLKNSTSCTFTKISGNHVVSVECEKVKSEEPKTYQISTEIKNGSFMASPGPVAEGDSCTVTWSGATAFVLDTVTVDGKEVETVGDSYTFSNVKENHSIKIVYKKLPQINVPNIYVIETSINCGGVITAPIVAADEAAQASQTVNWRPAAGYRVKAVRIDNVLQPELVGETGYTFTDIDKNHTVAVECERIPLYTISTEALNAASITPTTAGIQDGDDFTVTWQPSDGFVVSVIKVDGNSIELSGENAYTFKNVSRNHTIRVECAKENSEVEPPNQYTIGAAITGGSIKGSGIVKAGTKSHTVSWIPSVGYEVTSVTVDDVAWPQAKIEKNGGSVTFTDINENHRVSVECKLAGSGSETAYVTLDAGIKGGKFTPNVGAAKIAVGTDYTIKWTPADGYKVTSVVLDGEKRDDLLTAGEITFKSITVNHVLRVECEPSEVVETPEQLYQIYTKITNGTISDPFTSDADHRSYTVSWSADEGYEVRTVLIDGNENSQAKADGSITFNPIISGHTVDVYCAKKDVKPNQYTVDATITNGTITKSADAADAGGDITVNWVPKKGYEVKKVIIDGIPFGAAFDGCYTFNNLHANHTIEVVCSKITQTEPKHFSVTTKKSGGDGATISPSLPSVTEGAETTVTWDVKPGWRITDVTLNGQSLSSDEVNAGKITFNVYADNEIVVYVQKQGATSNAFLLVSTAIDHGWICNGGSVVKGSSYQLNWIPDDGYKVKSVEITDAKGNLIKKFADDELETWNYRINSVNSDTQVQVQCEKLPEGEETRNSYYVDTQISNGVIEGGKRVAAGENCTVTWSAASGYQVKKVTVYKGAHAASPMTISPDADSYTIPDIDDDWRIEVVCEALPPQTEDELYTYHVDTKISNGAINGPFTGLKKNDSVKVAWSASDGYEVESVSIDGREYPELVNQTSLQLPVEADDHEIEVVCVRKADTPKPDDSEKYLVKTYLYDGVGDITPWMQVNKNDDLTVSWKVSVDNHYKVSAVYADGTLTDITEDNIYTFENVQKPHTLEVYLEPNLVEIEVSYEGKAAEVSSSASIYWGEDYEVVGKPAPGWRLDSVTVDGKKLQPGETVDELVPAKGFMEKTMQAMAQLFAAAGDELQSEFAFTNVKQNRTVHYVFVPETGTSVDTPYTVGVRLVGGTGTPDARRSVTAGSDETLRWTLDEAAYYVDRVTVSRNGLETEIEQVDDASLQNNSVLLTNIQTDTEVIVYLKAGTKPSADEINDFSLNIDLVGPGSKDPKNWIAGEGEGLPAGTHTAQWHIAAGHTVTMVTVDGVVRPDLIKKTETSIVMNKDDEKRDHVVLIYVDGEVLPGLSKTAGDAKAKAGETVPYTISVWNETDEAIWSDVTISDVIPQGLNVKEGSLQLYRITGTEGIPVITMVTDANIRYDAGSRKISANVGDVAKGVRYELRFEATVTAEAVDKNLDIGNRAKAEGYTSGNRTVPVTAETAAVYPGGETSVIPVAPTPNIDKTAKHGTKTELWEDVISYSIEVWNSAPGSVWKNVQVKDVLPEGIELIEDSIEVTEVTDTSRLIITSQIRPQYDETNRMLMASLGDLTNGKRYLITFDAGVIKAAEGEEEKDIGNIAEAGGTDSDKNWVEVRTKKAYPNGSVEPDPSQPELPSIVQPKPRVEKSSRNVTHADGDTQFGDLIDYEIQVKNNAAESMWHHVQIVDKLPDQLKLKSSGIYLIYPDGTAKKLNKSEIYDEGTHTITVDLPQGIAGGETYWLKYRATVVADENAETTPKIITNQVLVSGEDGVGNKIGATASNTIRHPEVPEEPGGEDKPNKPGKPGGSHKPSNGIDASEKEGLAENVQTGDTTEMGRYILMLMIALILGGIIIRYRFRRNDKEE